MAKVRVTQGFIEVVANESPDLRVTQAGLEVLGTFADKLRVTQALLEVFGKPPSSLRVSQANLEAFGTLIGPAIPYVTTSNPTETTVDMAGTAFEQGNGSSAVHSASRWLARRQSTNELVYDSGETTDLTAHSVPTGGLPAGTNLIPGVMYKNGSGEWSYYPGQGDPFILTATSAVEAGLQLSFYDASWTLLSTYLTPTTTDTAYGDWIVDEGIPIPANTRYIVPCVYKHNFLLDDVRVKWVEIDRGLLAGGFHPPSYRPELNDETDIAPAGVGE